MTVAFSSVRILVPLLVAVLGAGVGCGTVKQEQFDETVRPLQDWQRESQERLAALEQRQQRHEQEIQQELAALRDGFERDMAEMDARYREYAQTALAFRDLIDDIDAIRQRNFGIYRNVHEMLNSMLDLYHQQSNAMTSTSSRIMHVIRRIEGMLEDLEEFAPEDGSEGSQGN